MSALALQKLEGKYEILEKLREGGMGALYKVRHRLLDEIRVIKLMRQQLGDDAEAKARFEREARLAIKLRHPNIAQIYDFTIDDDGTALIVMEFIDGLTLQEVLVFHGPPPLGFALEIAQQSLRALGYLHQRGFVHRDISPDNLMLTTDSDGKPLVKLIDLGIAKILGGGQENHLTQAGAFLGKIRYAAPEQFDVLGAATADARGDLYSFGIVLYELLTARFPIQGRDTKSLIAAHMFRPPLPFAESDPQGRVPDSLREAVLRSLASNPSERFASAVEMSAALEPLRAPNDVDPKDLPRLLTRPFVRIQEGLPAKPGSTQDRLNESFGLVRTPAPERWLQAGRKREKRSTDALAKAAANVQGHLDRGELTAAARLLEKAVAAHGERAPLPELKARLEALAQASAAEAGPTVLWAPETQRLPAAGAAAEVRGAAPVPQRPASWKLWASVAAGILLLTAVAIIVLRRPPMPAPGAPAMLILDAVPWGEVVRVADANGKPQAVGSQRYTPLVLSLLPGHYTVTLRNPRSRQPVSLDADLVAGTEVRRVAELGAISEDEFFRRMGW
jgi:serine/threonine protein kinase